MAKFKVGDRVRVIRATHDQRTVGKEATVTSELKFVVNSIDEPYWGHCICIDGYGSTSLIHHRNLVSKPSDLAPLTPPSADAWATEQVKKWTKPEPVAPTLPVRKLDHA